MRRPLLALVPLILAACHGPGPAPGLVDAQGESSVVAEPGPDARSQNHAAWLAQGAELARAHAGQWVLIARGEVVGTWRDFDSAWREADALPEEVEHAYLYRAGVDDVETAFNLSPFLSTDPHWVQLGRRIRGPWKLTIAAVGNTWIMGDKRVSWGDIEAGLVLVNPETSAERRARAVASNMFLQDLTLRPQDARALGLGRFTAPLPALYGVDGLPCEKVILRVRIPEFEIDDPAVAFVLPEEVVRSTAGFGESWDQIEWPDGALELLGQP